LNFEQALKKCPQEGHSTSEKVSNPDTSNAVKQSGQSSVKLSGLDELLEEDSCIKMGREKK
jgi:hypothetical protein